MKDYKQLKRGLTIGAAALMVVAGIVSICLMGRIEEVLAVLLAIVSIVSGSCYILAFCFMRRSVGAGFLLADGILTVVLGILLLFRHYLRISPEILFVALLVLIGVSMIRFSVEAKNFGIPKWWALLAVGIGSIGVGVGVLLIPDAVFFFTSVLMGIMLIVSGIVTGVGAVVADRNQDKIITVRTKDIEFIEDDAPKGSETTDNQPPEQDV